MECRDDMLMGLWKFDNDRVAEEDLEKLAEEFAQDENYVYVFLRGASKDQTGIGFVYKYDGTRAGRDKYHDETSHMLKMRFGNGLCGWDYSRNPTFVKGFKFE